MRFRVIEDRQDAAEVRGQVGELLAESFAEPPYGRTAREAEAMLDRFDRHARKPGFRLVLTFDGERPVALAYGYRLPADTGWWRDTLEPVPEEVAFEDGQRTFAVFELAVAPDRRREHLGTETHGALLDGRPEQRALLNVRRDAESARAAYAAWGYRWAASVVPWANAPVYDVMLLDLT